MNILISISPQKNCVAIPASAAARYWNPAVKRIRKKERYFLIPLFFDLSAERVISGAVICRTPCTY